MENINPNQQKQNPLANYQFSQDEIRVLRECNRESFFQRSLPLGTGLGVAAFLSVKYGYLQPNGKYGAIPKVLAGVVVGYFAGKFSYQQKCAEKIMRIPNSKLAELLKNRKASQSGGSFLGSNTLGVSPSLVPFISDQYDSYNNENRNPVLDSEVRLKPELDDRYRPTLDNTPAVYYEPEVEPTKPSLTYEELRKRNREGYKENQNSISTTMANQASQHKPNIRANKEHLLDNEKTNKYGDTWTD